MVCELFEHYIEFDQVQDGIFLPTQHGSCSETKGYRMHTRKDLNRRFDDFEYWSRLAARDPERFEQERAAMLQEYIRQMPEEQQQRLHKTQWKIDQVRSLAKNPVDSLNRVSKLMWDELMSLNAHQTRLIDLYHNGSESEKPRKTSAKILSFQKTTSE